MANPKRPSKKNKSTKKKAVDTADEPDEHDAAAAKEQLTTKMAGPKRRLTLLPPKKHDDDSPQPEENLSSSEEITPPPPVSKAAVKAALNSAPATKKRRTFEGGVQDVDEDSGNDSANDFQAGEDEDELESEDDEEEDSDEDSAGLPSPVAAAPVPTGKKPKKNKPIPLKFSVPVDGANMSFTVPSTTPFDDIVTKLANTMSVAPNKVRVAYRFSIQPRTDPYNHLGDEQHWEELIEAVRRTLGTTRSKKEFFIELKDLVAPSGKVKGKGKDVKKTKRKRPSSDSDESAAGSDDDNPKAGKPKKLSGPQWVARLQEDNACKEHGGMGCLKYINGHIKLSKIDLTTWAIFMQNGYQSTTNPPPKLKLNEPAPAPSQAAPVLAAPAANAVMPAMHPYGVPPYTPWPGWPMPGGPYQTPVPHPKPRYDDAPSSDPVEEVEDVTLFPRLSAWLQDLDSGPRGQDGHQFTEFAADLEREKYMRIVDLVDLETSDLRALIPEMAHGTATKLLSYAEKDVALIRRKEKKRARREYNHFP
ncbi:hypothetical protein B0H13DRAFT_2290928 [Mycena leptocephala]|nr:hypothetical protein B0H13DRAFT_2290928 [Mycena leptocephala]